MQTSKFVPRLLTEVFQITLAQHIKRKQRND